MLKCGHTREYSIHIFLERPGDLRELSNVHFSNSCACLRHFWITAVLVRFRDNRHQKKMSVDLICLLVCLLKTDPHGMKVSKPEDGQEETLR